MGGWRGENELNFGTILLRGTDVALVLYHDVSMTSIPG
jgi:hypothetical protein